MTQMELARDFSQMMGPLDWVYGEFVRDAAGAAGAAGADYKEMSVFLSRDWKVEEEVAARNAFLEKLKKRFGANSITTQQITTIEDSSGVCRKQKVKLTFDNQSIDFDIVTNSVNDPFVHSVADVNMLMIKNGQLDVNPGYDIATIRQHIKDKVYQAVAGREILIKHSKLRDEGYKRLMEKEEEKDPPKTKIASDDTLTKEVKALASAVEELKKTNTEQEKKIAEQEKQIKTVGEVTAATVKYMAAADDTAQSIKQSINEVMNKVDSKVDRKSVEFAHKAALKMNDDSTLDQKVNVMSSDAAPTMFEMMTSNGKEAAYRVAAHQMVQAVKKGLLAVMKTKGAKKPQIEAVQVLLEKEIGNAAISAALGYALLYVPMIKDHPQAPRLSEEFRVAGMATAGNLVFGEAIENFLPAIMNSLNALPAATEASTNSKARIAQQMTAAPTDSLAEQLQEAEESEHKVAAKNMTV